MVEIRRSRTEDKAAILELADSVFYDEKGNPENFAGLIPKLYGEKADCTDNHWLLFEDGKLQSLVLTEPMEYHVMDIKFPVAAIGTVSVSNEARGKGFMKLLMDRAVKELDEQGVVMTVLGGQRQRYAYWGFEPCGLQVTFTISKANIRHAYGMEERDTLTFRAIESGSAQEELAFAMHSQRNVHMKRDKVLFKDVLANWKGIPYGCFVNGKQEGYVVVKQEGDRVRLLETVLSREVTVRALLQTVFHTFHNTFCTISLPFYEQELITQLEPVCEHETVTNNNMYRIHDWKTLIEAFLKVNASYRKLSDGCLNLGITSQSGERTVLHICVKQGSVSVSCGSGEADAELTAAEAAKVLFYESRVADAMPEVIPADWFPLPLFMGEQDCC